MTALRAIGSVLPFPDLADAGDDSLWSRWTRGFPHHAAFASARSAIGALIQARGVARLWAPAYVCASAIEGAESHEVLWYGVDETLSPELDPLVQGLRPGDAVLGVDYFGRSPTKAFRDLARARRDVLWIEDRAQALAPDAPDWGDVVVYSPRKLVGVGDGGLMVSATPLPQPSQPGAAASQAQRNRRLDPDGRDPDAWFPDFQRQEAAFRLDHRAMSAETREALRRVAQAPLAAARRANWTALAERLGDMALWPEPQVAFAPLAFPVRAPDAGALAGRLAQSGIFCPRHWSPLPGPRERFPEAEALSATLLSLPCDHRYDSNDMARVAEAVRTAL